MTRNELNNEYFEWLYRLVCNGKSPNRQSYRILLAYLHSVDFSYILPMDGNRAENGIQLRYDFGYENSYEGPIIASYLDDRPCSVLEMMVALVIRCVDRIIYDPDIEDQAGDLFWQMIFNLGLGAMTDNRFEEDYVEYVIERFLNREYERNGEGGLFIINDGKRDMRSVDIWYQMCYYLEDLV